jgi:hypothetical protein
MVGIACLEGIEQFRQGKQTPPGKSGEWFKNSAKRVFPGHVEDVYQRIWEETRCGLFHMGFTRGKIYLAYAQDSPLLIEGDKLKIHPAKFLEQIEADFCLYIASIENEENTELRSAFEGLWDLLWDAT